MKHSTRLFPALVALLLTASFSLAQSVETIRVALFKDSGVSGPGVPCVTEQLAAAGKFEVIQINVKEIAEGALRGHLGRHRPEDRQVRRRRDAFLRREL